MHWFSSSLLACLVAVTVAHSRTNPVANSSELTLKEKLKYKVPPETVVLPPGVGLCMKDLPRDQCSIRYGGGRGLAEITRKNIVKRLEKRGWVKMNKFPRQINAVHICCHRKKFGMEPKPKDQNEKPEKWPPRKSKESTKKTWGDTDEGKKAKKTKYERTQMSETEKEDGEAKKMHKTNVTAPQEKEKSKLEIKPDTRKEKARETAKSKRLIQEEAHKHKRKENVVEPGRNMTRKNKWKTQTDTDEKPSKESRKKLGEDKTVKSEKENDKLPKLPPWMTKDLDKKLPDQYLEGEDLIDETDLW